MGEGTEEVGRLVDEAIFEKRRAHPLEYDAVKLHESGEKLSVWEVSLPKGF